MDHAVGRAPALSGIKVLDFTRVLAGPFCTLTLADLGADIIKVENTRSGDETRSWDQHSSLEGEAGYFIFANRNKRSIALDITSPVGREIVARMAEKVDVVVENFRPGVMEKHGLDHATLRKSNPRLIYCSISGYGNNSPFREQAGYDPIAQAESGMMSATGEPDGGPLRTPVANVDLFAALYASIAIQAALVARERHGHGEYIDISLLECAVAAMANVAQSTLISGQNPERLGNYSLVMAPVGPARCADGMVQIIIGTDEQWQRLCTQVLERPDWAHEPWLATNKVRCENRKAVHALLEEVLVSDTRENWIERFRRARLPVGTIRSMAEALEAPELRSRGLIKRLSHPRLPDLEVVTTPARLTLSGAANPKPAPGHGEHTGELLTEFGFTRSEIASFEAAGAVATGNGAAAESYK